jgi:hypothetical protein
MITFEIENQDFVARKDVMIAFGLERVLSDIEGG